MGARIGAVHVARTTITALIAACACLASALPSSALGDPPDPREDSVIVRRLVFETPLGRFDEIAEQRLDGDRWLDWSTDWCSAPLVGSTGRSFDFRRPCRRHDFAYRNTKLLDVRYGCDNRAPGHVCRADDWTHGRWWNAVSRAAIDRRFLSDMRLSCRVRRLLERPRCLMWAELFYRVVRVAGGP